MSKSDPAAAECAPIVKIALVERHTHAGRDYAPGAQLVLADIGMNQMDAIWLIANGVATDASNA